MANHRKDWDKIWNKLRFKYRVSVLNENTLEEAWHARLSRISVFVWMCLLIFITFWILALLILYTPLKHYLPGYGASSSIRAELIDKTIRVDSIARQLEIHHEYLSVLQSIVSGELKTDSVIPLDSIALMQREHIQLEKSKLEQEFCENFEAEEKYNLSILKEKPDVQMSVFFRPTQGILSSTFSIADRRFGISITAATPNEHVMSVLDGTVIYATLTMDYQWVIMVQHENEYLSIYKNNARLLKKTGDRVRAGETIAIVGNTAANEAGNQLYFELWQKGSPVNPADVIAL